MSRLILAFVLPLLLVAWTCASAATIHVPGREPTIQAGINAASEGDIVLVASGTYTGSGNVNLRFNGVNLVLMSEFGAASTIIDCEGVACGITMSKGEGPSTVIQGFTIRNGKLPEEGDVGSGRDHGAGMYIGSTCAPTIRDCLFEDCVGTGAIWAGFPPLPSYHGYGGGLSCHGNATITGCTFSGNSGGILGGGGVYCRVGSPVVTGCSFIENLGNTGGGFGGVGMLRCSARRLHVSPQ